MKKIGKLNINPQKVLKNVELTALRGGYGAGYWMCYRYGSGGGYCNSVIGMIYYPYSNDTSELLAVCNGNYSPEITGCVEPA
jgi:hypothetical protein